jgi:hypothetical protein
MRSKQQRHADHQCNGGDADQKPLVEAHASSPYLFGMGELWDIETLGARIIVMTMRFSRALIA